MLKDGSLYAISYDTEDCLGAYVIKDMEKWVSEDEDWESGAYSEALENDERVVALGEFRVVELKDPDGNLRKNSFGFFLTRFGVGWISLAMCKEDA